MVKIGWQNYGLSLNKNVKKSVFWALMEYRKLKADKIFDGYRFCENSVLIVDEGGMIEGIVPVKEAGEGIESFKGILSPGFINCHCHLELSHMKGRIPERTGLVDFVFKVVTERHHSKEEMLNAIEEAENEMIRNGIVAVGDICNTTLTLAQKQKGRMRYYNFIEASGWLPSVSQDRFERVMAMLDEYVRREPADGGPASPQLQTTNYKPPTSNCSIVPHAPYSVSENLWQQIQPYFKNKVVSIHNQETKFEDEFFLEGSGNFERMYRLMNIDNSHHRPTKKTSLRSYFDKLIGASGILLVHNTFTKQEDVEYVRRETADGRPQLQTTNHKPQTYFCLCPNANLYIENALPPVEMFARQGCAIVLGTDSLASNRSLNILDEIRTIRKNFPGISLDETLQWATSNGARALQMDDVLGSFEKGKRPAVVAIDEKDLTVQRII
jgi:aminodeoxyfutalosine deaminase